MQCKPLDTWSTHSSEAKRCVVNILKSSDSIIRATFSRYWMSLKCFAERNASFTNGRQIDVLCSTPMKEWLTTVILCFITLCPIFRGKSFWPRSVSPQWKTVDWERDVSALWFSWSHYIWKSNLRSGEAAEFPDTTGKKKLKNLILLVLDIEKMSLLICLFEKTGNVFVLALCLTSTPTKKNKEKSSESVIILAKLKTSNYSFE